MGWDFRSSGDSKSVCPVGVHNSDPCTTKAKCSLYNCQCDGVVLVLAVPAFASLGRLIFLEVTVSLPVNKGVTVLLQP